MHLKSVKLKRKLLREEGKKTSIHPWIFSGALASVSGSPEPDDTVSVFDASNNFIGYGHYNPNSGIAIKILSFHEDEYPDINWIFSKIDTAAQFREKVLRKRINSNSYRIVFGESDSLPGLIVDKYQNVIVIQTLTAGMDKIKKELAEHFMRLPEINAVIEKNDCEIRKFEGLELKNGILAGNLTDADVIINENGLIFSSGILIGQKTGFYLDQRDNRKTVADYVYPGMSVLDCFCYSGAFGIHALNSGAGFVRFLDNSQSAIDSVKNNLRLNNLSPDKTSFHTGSAFEVLREFRDRGLSFDLVILDPPKFAPTKSNIGKALRGYKDINMLGMKLLKPDGILATFSCSSGVSRVQFREMLQWAGEDIGVSIRILEHLSQPPDHPIVLNCPESEYLKGFLCRV